MDEIVKQVAERTGLPPEQARAAVAAVVEEIKKRLPEPYASQLDGLLAGSGVSDAAAQASQLLGGLFGNK